MSRTLAQIRQTILDEKATHPELDNIDTTSNAAMWKLIVDVIAFCMWVQEQFWDLFRVEVDTVANESEAGVELWYQQMVKEFQYGDELVYNTTLRKYEYPVIDTTKQIITHCSVNDVATSATGQLRIKVKAGDQTSRRVLTNDEMLALQSYVRKRKFAGTNVSITSYVADLLLSNLTIYYDPQIPIATVMAAVQAAVENYVKNLPFNGIFSINKLEDIVQAVPGVKYVVIDEIKVKTGGSPYELVSVKYNPEAGDMDVDTDSTIYNALNYVPDAI